MTSDSQSEIKFLKRGRDPSPLSLEGDFAPQGNLATSGHVIVTMWGGGPTATQDIAAKHTAGHPADHPTALSAASTERGCLAQSVPEVGEPCYGYSEVRALGVQTHVFY